MFGVKESSVSFGFWYLLLVLNLATNCASLALETYTSCFWNWAKSKFDSSHTFNIMVIDLQSTPCPHCWFHCHMLQCDFWSILSWQKWFSSWVWAQSCKVNRVWITVSQYILLNLWFEFSKIPGWPPFTLLNRLTKLKPSKICILDAKYEQVGTNDVAFGKQHLMFDQDCDSWVIHTNHIKIYNDEFLGNYWYKSTSNQEHILCITVPFL